MKKTTIIIFLVMVLSSVSGFGAVVTITGDCNSTCYISTDYYNITIKEGVASNYSHKGVGGYKFDRGGTSGEGSFSQIYCSAWEMTTAVTSTNATSITTYSNRTTITYENANAKQNWTFYESYMQSDITCDSNFRIYHYFHDTSDGSRAFIETGNLSTANGWADSDSVSYVAGMAFPLAKPNYIFAMNWETRTDFDYIAGGTSSYSGIAVARGEEFTANNWVTSYYKIIPTNASSSPYSDALVNFVADKTYGDPKKLYVNSSHASCDNSYSRLDNSLSQPWCTPYAPLDDDKMLSGDTLFIAAGTYNNEWDITSWTINQNTTITSYPGDTVYLTRYETSPTAWTNKTSSKGAGYWNTTSPTSGSTIPRIYFDGKHCIPSKTAEWFWANGTRYPCSSYRYANDTLWVHFNDTTYNPNIDDVKIVEDYNALYIKDTTINTGAWLKIANITFNYTIYAIQLENTDGIIIENNVFNQGFHSVYIEGVDSAQSRPIYIRNNTFDNKQNYGENQYSVDVKETMSETDMIYITDYDGPVYIYGNQMSNGCGAILPYTDDNAELCDSKFYDNTLSNMFCTVFEIENYACNQSWYNNKVYDSNRCFSLAPADSSSSKSRIYDNICYNNKPEYNDVGITYGGYSFKIDNRSTNRGVRNWDVYSNTFYGDYRVLNRVDTSSTETVFKDWNMTNNIMMSNTSYVIVNSGLASNGVHYDYNLYYDFNSVYLFGRWNQLSTNLFASLTDALASAQDPGTWDLNSYNSQPLFMSYDSSSSDFLVPYSDSPVCGAASDGGDIGALSCSATSSPVDPLPNITSGTYAQDYHSLEVNFTTSENVTVNWTFSLGSVCTNVLSNGTLPLNDSFTLSETGLDHTTTYSWNLTLIDSASQVNWTCLSYTTLDAYPNITSSSISRYTDQLRLDFNTSENVTVNWTFSLGSVCGNIQSTGTLGSNDTFYVRQKPLSAGTTYSWNLTLIDSASQTDSTCFSYNTLDSIGGSGGGGGSTIIYDHFVVLTPKIEIQEPGEGFSDYYIIAINSSTKDIFTYEVPANCRIQEENIEGVGLIKNKISCRKTQEMYEGSINVRSSIIDREIELIVHPAMEGSIGKLPYLDSANMTLGNILMLAVVGLIIVAIVIIGLPMLAYAAFKKG